jgi:hypothetical protein
VESYLGLVPGEDSSAERKRRTSITKAGPPALRWCLVQAAWAARRTRRKDPIHRWGEEIEKRRGRRVAVLALARKLAGILYAIGETEPCTIRVDLERPDGVRLLSFSGDRCPVTQIDAAHARAGRPRKTDCDPSTNVNLMRLGSANTRLRQLVTPSA